MSAFISKWHIIGHSSTLTLPLLESGTYDFMVDWGDGKTQDHITSYNASHRYLTGGIYEVTITGIIKGWKINHNSGTIKLFVNGDV
jgi:hypothetical protein